MKTNYLIADIGVFSFSYFFPLNKLSILHRAAFLAHPGQTAYWHGYIWFSSSKWGIRLSSLCFILYLRIIDNTVSIINKWNKMKWKLKKTNHFSVEIFHELQYMYTWNRYSPPFLQSFLSFQLITHACIKTYIYTEYIRLLDLDWNSNELFQNGLQLKSELFEPPHCDETFK